MEFTALFLAVTVVMGVAWRGPRPLALTLFAAVWLVIGLTALNVISTLLECGFGACAENPTVYELRRHGA